MEWVHSDDEANGWLLFETRDEEISMNAGILARTWKNLGVYIKLIERAPPGYLEFERTFSVPQYVFMRGLLFGYINRTHK